MKATELGGANRSVVARAGEGAPLAPDTRLATRNLLAAPQQHSTPERNVVVADLVEGAVLYQLQLARDPGFLQLVAESRRVSPRFELPGDLAPGFYHTRLSAVDAQQIEGIVGSGLVFASYRAIPEESAVQRLPDGSYEIRWTPRRNGRHTFELAQTPDFTALIARESGIYPGGVTVGPLEAPSRYYWRCREEAEGDRSAVALGGQLRSTFPLKRENFPGWLMREVRRRFLIEWILMFLLLPSAIVWLDGKPGLVDANAVFYDRIVRDRPPIPSGDILIIGVDKRSLDALGSWPFPRSIHAQLLDQLAAHAPQAVLFDVFFDGPAADPEKINCWPKRCRDCPSTCRSTMRRIRKDRMEGVRSSYRRSQRSRNRPKASGT